MRAEKGEQWADSARVCARLAARVSTLCAVTQHPRMNAPSSLPSLFERHCSSSELRGYRHMRQLQECAYDTIDDLDTCKINTLQEFYEAVLGPALRQTNVCGLLISGTRDMTSAQNCTMAWGTQSVAFPQYDEVWQVRSAPRGCMGKPIAPGEVRKVAVLVRPNNANGKASRITTIKLWVITPVDALKVSNQRQYGTYGAHGVNMTGIHLFEHHGRRMLAEKKFTEGRNNYRVVHGSFVSAMSTPPPQLVLPKSCLNKDGKMIASVQSCPLHHMVIATSLMGRTLEEQPGGVSLPGTRELCSVVLEEKRDEAAFALTEVMLIDEHVRRKAARVTETDDVNKLRVPTDVMNGLRSKASALMAMSESLCEQLSHCGFLDISADSFFEQATPDSMHRPCGMPLLIALAVRIACFPERVGLPPGKVDDQLAAREAANMLESVQPAVLPGGTESTNDDADCSDTEPQYALDIVLQHTVTKLLSELEALKAKNSASLPKSLRGQCVDQIEAIHRNAKEALAVFYRTGIALCVDLVGNAPRREDGTSGVYTRMGLAEGCCDAVEHAKAELAYRNNLGFLSPRVDPMRCTTRGAQQMALARTMLVVERWLCHGTYCGTRLLLHDDDDTELERANVHAAASSTLSRCFSPAADTATAEECSKSPGFFSNPNHKPIAAAMESVAENAAAVKNSGGSKKRQRRAIRQGAQKISDISSKLGLMKLQEDETVQDQLSSRSRRRADFDARMIHEALASLGKKSRGGTILEEAMRGLGPGSGRNIDDATAVFSEVLVCGACPGTTAAINFQCFLIGTGSTNNCCNCNKPIHVVESLAFGGHFAACRTCKHPRCLDCVQHDIHLAADMECCTDLDAVAYRDIENCLFCAHT